MLLKNHIKVIKSLSQKKFRQQFGLFVVEGVKSIDEFLKSNYELESLFTTDTYFAFDSEGVNKVSITELKKISNLKNPNTALAVFKIPKLVKPAEKGLIVALDAVRDPGNLGTIIRLCDWYGITDLICSETTVDCYNPKVVQATMGSLTRVNVVYLNLEDYLKTDTRTLYGTYMQGEAIYESDLNQEGIIVLGNEANGISDAISTLVDYRITIPQFGNLRSTESLNVASASAIILSEFKRRTIET